MRPRSILKNVLSAAAATVVLCSAAGAATYYVRTDGDDGADGLGWQSAHRTVSTALLSAQAGDCVKVAEGAYAEMVSVPDGVSLLGGCKAYTEERDPAAYPVTLDSASLQPDGVPNYATVSAWGNTTIDGFTIKGGRYGVVCRRGALTVQNCLLTGNGCAGVLCSGASATISGNTFADNGAGIHLAGCQSVVITDNTLTENAWGGLVCEGSSPTVHNNRFIHNLADGIGCLGTSSPVVESNYFYANTGAAVACPDASVTVRLNRIIGNERDGVICGGTGAVVAGNVIAGNGGYGVKADSATNALIVANSIVSQCGTGVGCGTGASILNNIVAFNGTGIAGTQPTLDHNCVYGNKVADYSGCSAGPSGIAAAPALASIRYADCHIQPASPCRDQGGSIPEAAGLSTDIDGQPRLQGSAVDIGADESAGEQHTVVSRVWYVNASAPAGGDGTSWDRAFRSIPDAIATCALEGGGEVWVSAGTYSGEIRLLPGVWLYGGFAGGEDSRTRRATLTNQTALQTTDLVSARLPVAVTGACLSGIDGCVIRNSGTGVLCDHASTDITGCLMVDNQTGVDCMDASPSIGSCTISVTCASGNLERYGVQTTSGRPPSIRNCIIALELPLGFQGQPTSAMRNNCFNSTGQSLNKTETNIVLDPVFVNKSAGDFHLMAGSPCINAGSLPAGWEGETDADGQPRVFQGTPDMGMDEFVPGAGTPVVKDAKTYVAGLNTPISASWTASATDPLYTRYRCAAGTSPTDPGSGYLAGWTDAGQATSFTFPARQLTADQICYVYVQAQNPGTPWSPVGVSAGAIALPAFSSLADAKASRLGHRVVVTGLQVSKSLVDAGERSNSLYLQQPSRCAGLIVLQAQQPANRGDVASVAGTLLATTAGLWMLAETDGVQVTGHGPEPVPLAASAAAILAGRNIGTPAGGRMPGVSLAGLLASVRGRVTTIGDGCFYVDDGSGLNEYGRPAGIPIGSGTLTAPQTGQYVQVTGPVSVLDGRVYPRSQADIKVWP